MKTKFNSRAACIAALASAAIVAGCVQNGHTDSLDKFTSGAPILFAQNEPEPIAVPGPPPSEAPTVVRKFDARTMPLSAGLQDVVSLVQAGLSEGVIRAFIEKSQIPYNPTADEVIYLNDVGVPSSLITAMLERGAKVREKNPGIAAAPAAPPPPPARAVETVPPPPAATVPAHVEQFYSSLAPYGTWMVVSDVGWCWRPQVAVMYSDWRPYADRGRWLHSDLGWYWQSDYSWGWAPFHYGRWTRHHRHGWIWTPDTVWGPAWVTWRYTDGYCGWAPLPHGAVYDSGLGFFYRGSRVAWEFDFGLGWNHFTFIASDRFCHGNPYGYYLPATRVQKIYNQTTVINNYNITANNVVINNGIPASNIPAVARKEVRPVSVREWSPVTHTSVAPDRVATDKGTQVIYRPQAPQAVAQAAAIPNSRVHSELVKPAIAAAQATTVAPGTTGRPTVTPSTSAPTGASANVRPFDTPTQPPTTVSPRAIPTPGTPTTGVTRPEPPKTTTLPPINPAPPGVTIGSPRQTEPARTTPSVGVPKTAEPRTTTLPPINPAPSGVIPKSIEPVRPSPSIGAPKHLEPTTTVPTLPRTTITPQSPSPQSGYGRPVIGVTPQPAPAPQQIVPQQPHTVQPGRPGLPYSSGGTTVQPGGGHRPTLIVPGGDRERDRSGQSDRDGGGPVKRP